VAEVQAYTVEVRRRFGEFIAEADGHKAVWGSPGGAVLRLARKLGMDGCRVERVQQLGGGSSVWEIAAIHESKTKEKHP